MNLRRLERADSTDVLALWNRTVRFDALTEALLEEKIWDDPDFDRDLNYVLENDQGLVGMGVGVIRQLQHEQRGYIKLLLIEKKHQRQGWGGRLLQEIEAGLTKRGVDEIRICESAPNYLTPGIDVRYTKSLFFFEKQGYERIGETYNLDVDLTAAKLDTGEKEQELAEKGIAVRRAKHGDRSGVLSLLDEHWAAWKPEIERCFRQDPISLHIAAQDENVLGFSAYDTNNLNTGWFGPMGTAPEARGLGIGGVLLLRCLQDQKGQGHAQAIIPWVGPIRFYAHYAGAEIARIFYRYRKSIP